MTTSSSCLRKLLWMFIIWVLSVLALGVVASVFKGLMYAAGMRTH